jgi:putative photosynthetic complex assembly protein 2
MTSLGLSISYCLFAWWFSTGAVIYLDGLAQQTFKWSLLAAGLAAVASLYGLNRSSADTSVGGAYVAFTCALIVWGWLEMSFLMGVVTGPRRLPCPAGASGLRRFRYAVDAILYHELAILVAATLVVAVTAGGGNHVGVMTFLILWVMRLSAKLNIFFGVRNLTEEFLPEQISYLKTYFRKRPMNPFFPLSVLGSTLIAILLAQRAMAPGVSDFDRAGDAMLATLITLATVEHWLLVLPVRVEKLWSWGMRSRRGKDATAGPQIESCDKSRFEVVAAGFLRAPAPTEMPID